MGMTWNVESHAKLFMAVLAQMKEANVKLDYKELAEYMGPECTHVAVRLQIQKLRREVGTPGGTEQGGNSTDAATPTPTNRKGGATAGKGNAKKAKKGVKSAPTVVRTEDESEDGVEEDDKEIKEEEE